MGEFFKEVWLSYKENYFKKAFDFKSVSTSKDYKNSILVNSLIIIVLNLIICLSGVMYNFNDIFMAIIRGFEESFLPGLEHIFEYGRNILEFLIPIEMIEGIQYETIGNGAVVNMVSFIKTLFILNITVPTLSMLVRRIRKIYSVILLNSNRDANRQSRYDGKFVLYQMPKADAIIFPLIYCFIVICIYVNLNPIASLFVYIVIFALGIWFDSIILKSMKKADQEYDELQKKRERAKKAREAKAAKKEEEAKDVKDNEENNDKDGEGDNANDEQN